MSQSTISIKRLPEGTTEDKIKQILSAFNVVRIHINGDVAYVEFDDPSDIESLQFCFSDFTIPKLNDAEIDKEENFNWSIFKSKSESIDETGIIKLESNSDQMEDLMIADKNNLIVVRNCDENVLRHLTVNEIKQIFGKFRSINRILKKTDEVIIQFLDLNQIELLEMQFGNLNVPKLGAKSEIDKVDENFKTQDFTSEWSKLNQQHSQITQATNNHQQKQQQQNLFILENQSPSKQVLHSDIIPNLNKITSMEQQFLLQQSRQIKPKVQTTPIKQQNTHQQLDFPSETEISDNNQKQKLFQKEEEAEQRERQIIHQKQTKQEQKVQFILEDSKKEDQQKQKIQKRKLELLQQENRAKAQIAKFQLQKKKKQEQRMKKEEQQRQKKQIQRVQKQILQKKKKTEEEQRLKQLEAERILKVKLQQQQQKNKIAEKKLQQQRKKLAQLEAKTIQNLQRKIQEQKKSQWNIRPDVNIDQIIQKNPIKNKRVISQTLITVSLLVWVVFLLIQ